MTEQRKFIAGLAIALVLVVGLIVTLSRNKASGSTPNAPEQKQKVIPEKYYAQLNDIQATANSINQEVKKLPQDVVQKVLALQQNANLLQIKEKGVQSDLRRDLHITTDEDLFWKSELTTIQGKPVWVLNWQDPSAAAKPSETPAPEKK